MLQGLIQQLRSGEESDDWNLFLLRQGHVDFRGWRADKKPKSEDPLLRHALETSGSAFGIVAVIESLQLDLAAEYSTFVIDHVEVGRGAENGLAAKEVRRPIQGRARSNQYAVVTNARCGSESQRGTHCNRENRA